MSSAYHNTPLFGGAITVNLPVNWIDVSNIRDVPDNQEVYLDIVGLSSIIIEINQRVDKEDSAAVQFHLEDIVGEDPSKVWEQKSVAIANLPNIPAYATLFTTAFSPVDRRNPPHDSQYVASLVTIIRLKDQTTDLVININMPHTQDQVMAEGSICKPGYEERVGIQEWDKSKTGGLLRGGLEAWEEIVKSFTVVDWGLFGEDEEEGSQEEAENA